ncbi:hypothetical protein [Mesorhizobium sp. CAU 1741]|uniref:hypothetical protein n=1 Tax=Mesorhizobium sp. CAU 1741 TaxID=3140366 RepID=UPI00325BEBFF
MDLRFKDELAQMPDLRHRLRRLRWFRATFRANAKAVTRVYGLRYDIDDTILTKVFLDWVETVETQKDHARLDRADFIVFAAGLVLRELIRCNPARLASEDVRLEPGQDPELMEIARFWPEGFLYTNYCVSAISAIHEQEFGHAPQLDSCVDDLRTWWSYRENAEEMPALAIAFLDRFLGTEPNWAMPDTGLSRQAVRQALSRSSHDSSLPHQA